MRQQRVVITGLGAVASTGIGISAFAQALRNGSSGVSRIESIDISGFPYQNGCEVRGFRPERWIRRLDHTQLGRSSQFAVAAARLAIEGAGINAELLSRKWCGVSIGTAEGESQPLDQLAERWVKQGPGQLEPGLLRQVPSHQLSVAVAREFQLHGKAVTLPTACAAGNYAIGHAYDMLCVGEADFMICGGVDTMSRKTFAGFYRLGTVAPVVCQPFDRNRQGISIGEGAGMLVLESLDSAVARGAYIYAEILGYGLTCDANHMVAPDRESIARCMRLAHRNAGISPTDVDYIAAHGTGTRANDSTEAAAIRDVFGKEPPPTSSIKSMIGHTMGAAGALSGISCALALDQGFLPPTMNFQTPDPECALDCVPNEARSADVRTVQCNAFGFGGHNSIIIFSKYSA